MGNIDGALGEASWLSNTAGRSAVSAAIARCRNDGDLRSKSGRARASRAGAGRAARSSGCCCCGRSSTQCGGRLGHGGSLKGAVLAG